MAPVAKADDGKKVLNVEIFGEIGWDVDAAAFSRSLSAAGELDEISLSIHSPGGSVLDGWAVANILLNHPAQVRGRVEGMAASMASVILCACDVREIPENAYVMIHNVSGGEWGGSEDMRRMADLIDKLTGDIAAFYVSRTGQTPEQISQWMDAETWMNGTEAADRGFATVLLPSVKAAALVSGLDSIQRRFTNLPSAISDAEETDETAPVEPVAPAAPAEPVEPTEPVAPAEPAAPVEAHQTRISKLAALKAFFTGGEGARPAPVDQVSTLRAQLQQERQLREDAVNRAQALERDNEQLQREARDLDAVLEELGLSAAEASDLPANSTDDEVLSVKERFKQMAPGPDRTAFFKAHKAELER